MLRNILLLFAFLFPLFLFSQSKITGQILDEENNPIEFTTINLQTQDNILIKTEFSDENGKFEIEEKQGNYLLDISYLGNPLFTQEIELNNNIDLGIIKVENSFLIEEIVIELKQKPIFNQEYDKFIFNVENSPLKQGYDGLEVLKRTPKLQVDSKGNVLLRNSSVLVLVNGRKMMMSGEELTNYLSNLNSENIKNIEIQNVGSADTDASNTGGVVNIVLKKVPTGFQSTLKTFYIHRNKENHVYFGGITNQFGSEKWNVYNKINYSEEDNLYKYNSTTSFYENNGRNENRGNNNIKNKNFNTTTGIVFYPNEKYEIGTEFYYSKNKSDRNGLDVLNVFNPNLSATADNTSTGYNTTDFWYATINYNYKLDSLGSKLKLISDIGNNKSDNHNEVDTKYSFGSLSDNLNRYITNANSDFYNIQADWIQKLKTDLELNFGTKLSNISRKNQLNTYLFEDEWNLTPNGQENFENNENIYANYLSIATKFKEKHQLKVGLRTEYTDLKGTDFVNNTEVKQSYFDWFPNFYYSYELKENQNISFSYSRRIQRPSFRDLNPFVIKLNDFLYQEGNPNLKPQYTDKLDLSYQYKKHFFSIYGNLTNNYITGIYTIDNNNVSTFSPQNFGKINDFGFDYSYSENLTDWLYSNISLGSWYYDFEVQNTRHNRVSGYLSSYFQVKFTKTLFLDVYNNFTSKNQFGLTKGAEQYRLDLALQKNIWEGSGLIRIAFEDVFNTERDKNISYYDNFDFRFYQKRLTQSFVIMFIYTFKNKEKFDERNVQQSNENKNRL